MPRTTSPPTFRLHKVGQWFTKWGGKNHYFGTDKDAAYERYLESLTQWQEWKLSRADAPRERRSRYPTLAVLIADFLDRKEREFGYDTRYYYDKHLKRAVGFFGHLDIDIIRPRHLAEIKDWMIQKRYAPKTICHDLNAFRTLFNWASGLEIAPAVNWKGVKNPPLGPPPDRSKNIAAVRRLVEQAPQPMGHWLAVTYLALLRPSETVKCVAGEGRWVEAGIFRLDRGKMDYRTSMARHCVFSGPALKRLKRCQPIWSRLDSFSQAVRDELGNGNGPGCLRHSAASHLSRAGVDPADIEILLGHAPKRLAVTYYQPGWTRLRRKAAVLVL